MMRKIAILGSTGSIGESTLKVIRHLGKEAFKVSALAVHSNIDLVEQQALEFLPEIIAVYDEEKAKSLQKRLPSCTIIPGMEGLMAVASHGATDLVVSSMTGTLGLVPTYTAICAGKNVALANKEALVSGGELIMAAARKHKVDIIPIDSEHSAIFQCLNGEKKAFVQRIILTSSGGPFRDFSPEQLHHATISQALKHPAWRMGPKVTIDSSTLMNKGLEVIEAYWLFGVPIDKIEVIIHPQVVIHSMVEFLDNSIMAQLGETTMIVPIQYALTYPERMKGSLQPFDFFKASKLEFFPPNLAKFPCLRLAFEALNEGRSLPCFMNAANEVLVHRFIKNEIPWLDIASKLERLMNSHPVQKITSLEDTLAVDNLARTAAAKI